MLIDWFTVCAQVINFLILVWLLKRFLYQPILTAIDAREKSIADQIAQAATKQADAQKEREEFQKKNTDFDQQRAALLSKAEDDAKVEHQKLLDQAHTEFDALRSQQTDSLNQERESVSQGIIQHTAREVFAIARKTLADLASKPLEASMADVFVQRLRALSPEEKGHLTDALKESTQTALVRSAFDLPEEQQAAIDSAVKEILNLENPVHFETMPDLVSGIELTTQGYKLSWSITDYLDSLEKSVSETLKV